MLMMKFPLTLAPTGMVPTKEQNDNLPVSPKEIAKTVKQCAALGITSVHLHARDKVGQPAWERSIYQQIIFEVRSVAPEVLINVSTSGRNWSELEKRADVLSLEGDYKPDIASLTTSSLNFLKSASVNEPETVRNLARIMIERGIHPELELFDLGMVNAARILLKDNVLALPLLANVFLGNAFSAQASPSHLASMIGDLPEQTIWSGAGIGDYNLTSYAMALASGGGVRVGLEDGIFLRSYGKRTLTSNEALVQRVLEIAIALDLSPMSGQDLKSRLANAS